MKSWMVLLVLVYIIFPKNSDPGEWFSAIKYLNCDSFLGIFMKLVFQKCHPFWFVFPIISVSLSLLSAHEPTMSEWKRLLVNRPKLKEANKFPFAQSIATFETFHVNSRATVLGDFDVSHNWRRHTQTGEFRRNDPYLSYKKVSREVHFDFIHTVLSCPHLTKFASFYFVESCKLWINPVYASFSHSTGSISHLLSREGKICY